METAKGISVVHARKIMYISHTLISKFKTYNKEKQFKTCVVLSTLVRDNGIVFSLAEWQRHLSKFISTYKYKLSLKNGKFNFYITQKYGATYTRIVEIENLLERLKYRNGKTVHFGLAKAQKQRLYKVIKDFCTSKNIKIKHLSRNPITLIKQLCYPGLQILNDDAELIRLRKFGRFAKGDITKNVFGNNGTKNRRLLINSIKKVPTSFQPKCLLLYCIRRVFGSDIAQNILEKYGDNLDLYCSSNSMRPIDSIKKWTTFFSRLSKNQILKLFSKTTKSFHNAVDTLRMSEGCDIPPFRDLNDLHDKLADKFRIARQRELRELEAEENAKKLKDFDIPLPFQELYKNWNLTDFELVYPKNGLELCEWSEEMKNCVASYENNIRKGFYWILGIKIDGKLTYNVGYNVFIRYRTNELKYETYLSQFLGKCNTPPLKEHQAKLIKILKSVE